MQYTNDHINKRVVYYGRPQDNKPPKYGYIRDIADLGIQEINGEIVPKQMLDVAYDQGKRARNYVWASECELLTEEHPEYDGPTG